MYPKLNTRNALRVFIASCESVSYSGIISPLQIPDAYVGPVCRGGLHAGLLPLRSEQQEQAASQLAVGSLQSIWQEVS